MWIFTGLLRGPYEVLVETQTGTLGSWECAGHASGCELVEPPNVRFLLRLLHVVGSLLAVAASRALIPALHRERSFRHCVESAHSGTASRALIPALLPEAPYSRSIWTRTSCFGPARRPASQLVLQKKKCTATWPVRTLALPIPSLPLNLPIHFHIAATYGMLADVC